MALTELGSSIIVMRYLSSILTSVLLLVAPLAKAQNASFTAGINYLTQTNLPAAYKSFASAVAASPTNAAANVYLAMTRILIVPSQPAGSNFLTRLGFHKTGRNIYDWTAEEPTNSNRKIIIPSSLNADEFTAQLRTNVLLSLIAAQTNLAQITDTNFTLFMPDSVTHFHDVTIDYGDVQVMRAMLNTSELFIYTLYSWNLDASITSVSNIIHNDKTFESLLTNFPKALTYATTKDKTLAETAFTSAAALYFAGSDFIRNVRPSGETYLFNLSTNEQPDELKFRETLTNLVNSVDGPAQPLPTATNISVSMAAFFSDASSPRSLLPSFQGSSFVWDSWPDATLGGVVNGLTKTNLDKRALKEFNAWLETPGLNLTTLTSFSNNAFNAGVILGSDGNVYCTDEYGGSYYEGSILKITPSGKTTTLYQFGSDKDDYSGGSGPNPIIQGSDGYLYGTTQYGGNFGEGLIFRISTAGSYSTLYNFGEGTNDGSDPLSALTLGTDGNLYGTTSGYLGYDETRRNGNEKMGKTPGYFGGSYGTIFSFSPASRAFTVLHSFDYYDGGSPSSPMIQGKDGYLYGVTSYDGAYYDGTIFRIQTTGESFSDLHDFGQSQDGFGNSLDGAYPNGLTQGADGNFYGTTESGGANGSGSGTLFCLSNGVFSLTTLYSFDQKGQDGYYPVGALAPSATGKFYGVTSGGGANSRGTIFTFTPGSAPGTVAWLTKDTGGSPQGIVAGANGNYYGATASGGNNGNGGVYELSASSTSTSTGGIKVTIEPASVVTAGAQWAVDGGAWQPSGTTVSGLAAGSYTVTFSNIYGWTTPASQTVSVKAKKTETATGTYKVEVTALKVTISPPAAVSAGAKWKVDDGAYKSSGATVTGLEAGSHVVSFNTIKGWVTPQSQTVPVSLGTNIATGAYSPIGSVEVTITPAVLAETATWQIDSGATEKSGATATNLQAGTSHSLTFASFDDWNLPTNASVFVKTNATAKVTAAYTFKGAGIYNGLFLPASNPVAETNTGMLSALTVTPSGAYSGSVLLDGAVNHISSNFNTSGMATNVFKSTAKVGGKVTMVLGFDWDTTPPTITGTVSNETWASELTAEPRQPGVGSAEYTGVIRPSTNNGTPPGYGYLLVTNYLGTNVLSVKLADGTSFSQSVPLSSTGRLPLYGSLYSKSGLVAGWLTSEGSNLAGTLNWIKPTSRSSANFTNGFSLYDLQVTGSAWTNSAAAVTPFTTNGMRLVLEGGGLDYSLTNLVELTPLNTLKLVSAGTNFTSGAINRTNGLLTVVFTNSAKKKITATGAAVQSTGIGGGFFLSGTNAGSMILNPANY